MAKISINASCKAKDGTIPEFSHEFEVGGRKDIMSRYGLSEEQLAQEAADNIGRRITNGIRSTLRDKGAEVNTAELVDYAETWVPGRRASASPINAVKKMLKESEGTLSPEAAEKIESLLAQQALDIQNIIDAAEAVGGIE